MAYPVCVKCGEPVEGEKSDYELFESMHWRCFHFQFEHEGDAEKPCWDENCPANKQKKAL